MLVIVAVIGGRYFFPEQAERIETLLGGSPGGVTAVDYSQDNFTPATTAQADFSRLEKAIANREFEVWLEELPFTVVNTLSDDNEGSRHQRFIVQAEGLPTLLIAHNIDLAPRVPLDSGDAVKIKGRYEWNNRGGVIHWTHHDPNGNSEAGWIRHQGELYE